MTFRATVLLLLGSVGAPCSCHGGSEPVEPVEPTEPTDTAVEPAVDLSPSTPQGDFPLPAFARPPTVLFVTIGAIENPQLQPFSVAATLEPVSGREGATIGTFTPFPPDLGGEFALGLPEPVQELLASSDQELALRLALDPIFPAQPLVEPLTVTVTEIDWQ